MQMEMQKISEQNNAINELGILISFFCFCKFSRYFIAIVYGAIESHPGVY